MRRYRIRNEGSSAVAPLTVGMRAWRAAEVALALALGRDDYVRAEIARSLALIALARTLEGREN